MCPASGHKAQDGGGGWIIRAADDVGLNQQGRAEKLAGALSEEYARFSAMNCLAVDTCLSMH